MVDRVRVRGPKSFNTIEGITESLRDYNFQVEDLARLIERHRSRTVLVGYLLMSTVVVVLLMGAYVIERIGSSETGVLTIAATFIVTSAFGLPVIAYTALARARQLRGDLRLAMERLSELMRHASQVNEHMDLERLDELLLQFRLKEADAILRHASRALKPLGLGV